MTLSRRERLNSLASLAHDEVQRFERVRDVYKAHGLKLTLTQYNLLEQHAQWARHADTIPQPE